MISSERKQEIIEEADYLEHTIGWNATKGYTTEETLFFWDYVSDVLGLDSCETCGMYLDACSLNYDGICDECQIEDEDDTEDDF